jgi:transketolase
VTVAPELDLGELRERAKSIRRKVVQMAAGKGEGYVGQGLQAADIFAALFFGEMKFSSDPADADADRFVLSTGHYSIALWATFAEAGLLSDEQLDTYGADDSRIAMSTERGLQDHVELTGGSLGHGLGVAAGIAYGRRLQSHAGRVFCYMTDGEVQEGSVWEAAMFAADKGLSSLVNVIDVNRTQADGPLVLEIEPLAEKWRGFGWWAEEVDGNNLAAVSQALARAREEPDRPKAIICHTQLGFGVPMIMERERNHFVRVDANEWQEVARQVEAWDES